MAKEKEKKDVILLQDNVLTESRYNFNRLEKNCLYKIIEKVRHDYIEHPNTATIEGFNDMTVYLHPNVLEDITDKTHKKDAHDALISLRKRDIEINWEDGSWFNCGFVNWCEYDAKNKVYKVEVSRRIMPYLVDLAGKYTIYSLTVAMTLKSTYSQRFYELCCQYLKNRDDKGVPWFFKTQQQLRQMFCLEAKYKDNQDFNRRVVYKAQDELEKAFNDGQCDLYFDVKVDGRGKAMKYYFKIHTRQQSEDQKKTFGEIRQRWLFIQHELLKIYPKDTKFVARIMKSLDFNPGNIDPVFVKIQKLRSEFKGADLAKVLRYVLKADFELK